MDDCKYGNTWECYIMGMMDTSTKFEYRGTHKILVVYSCRQCLHYIYRKNEDNELDRHWCYHNKMHKIEVTHENLEKLLIPEWCKLKEYTN